MNIAIALKSEIARVARKELRGETQQLKKSSSHYRAEIAAMKRRITQLERAVKALAKPPRRAEAPVAEVEAPPVRNRFSPSGLAAARKRLGLGAHEMGALVGVSDQSIYKWEQEKTVPRAAQLPALRAAMKLGKREALAKLAALA